MKFFRNNLGSAFFELTLVLPIFVFVGLSSIDLMEVISYHQQVSMISKETGNLIARSSCVTETSVDQKCMQDSIDPAKTGSINVDNLLPGAQIFVSVYGYNSATKVISRLATAQYPASFPVGANGCKAMGGKDVSCYDAASVAKNISSLGPTSDKVLIAEVFYPYKQISPKLYVNYIPSMIYETTIYSLVRIVREEHAAYMVIMAITLVALFLLAAFMVDSGNLFLAQMRMQRAMDAGVVRALTMVSANKPQADIQDVSTKVIYDNLKTNAVQFGGVDPTKKELTVVVKPADASNPTTVYATSSAADPSLSGKMAVPTMLMDVLPSTKLGPTQTVTSFAKGENDAVAMSLVLDVSGSMGKCTTQTLGCQEKIDALRQAVAGYDDPKTKVHVKGILDIIDPDVDFIAVTIFSPSAKQIFTLDDRNKALYPQPKKKGDPAVSHKDAITILKGIINRPSTVLDPETSTNIASGISAGADLLTQAMTDNKNGPAVITKYARRAIILITDGAPTEGNSSDGSMFCLGPKQGYYLGAINEADKARDKGITVHAIGLGPVPPASCSSEYQCGEYDDESHQVYDNYVKSYLLRRVTNNSDGIKDPAFNDKKNGTFCVPQYDQIKEKPHGLYKEAPSSTELPSMLLQIGYYIKNRLVK